MAAHAPSAPALACVLLAHSDPAHVHRLIASLAPFPVFLHCDVKASDDVFADMTRELPDRVTVQDRLRTGWARWENVAAEIEGYRAALATTDASHIGVFTGSDYPLVSTHEVSRRLAEIEGRSVAYMHTFPHPHWGRSGGYDRLRYSHWPIAKRMLRLPVPRKKPRGLVFAGGSQLKVLARHHAEAVVRAYDENPAIVDFWKRSWIADETFVPTILSTPRFVPDWAETHIQDSFWWIRWGDSRTKSPSWLGLDDLEALLSRTLYDDQTSKSVFARKFSTEHSTAVLDAIDAAIARSSAPAEEM